MHSKLRVAAAALALAPAIACRHAAASTAAVPQAAVAESALLAGPQPPAAPARWVGLIGEYDAAPGMRLVLEDRGSLWIADTVRDRASLAERAPDAFAVDASDAARILGARASELRFTVDGTGRASAISAGSQRFPRRDIEPQPGTNQLRVTPVRSVESVRAEALAATPPREAGPFKPADLVELTKLDPTIRLEIRYATTNNFLGTKFYEQARAFMQRPAAEAVVRANQALRRLGYGLLIHDAYRPWFVTKMFWDATPAEKRWLVANPTAGSKHNRGAAVDLTLFDLRTGAPIEMPSTYDESTDRAYADYPGGTSLQRWHRALLRRAMEAQGFTVNPTEWWHFDYKDWREYGIGNVAFDRL